MSRADIKNCLGGGIEHTYVAVQIYAFSLAVETVIDQDTVELKRSKNYPQYYKLNKHLTMSPTILLKKNKAVLASGNGVCR